jgi:hypothetical protein
VLARRRRWLCPEALREVRTWFEHINAIARPASLTERAGLVDRGRRSI